MQTILIRLLDLAQRKHDLDMEYRTLIAELTDNADREAEIHGKLHYVQRGNRLPVAMPQDPVRLDNMQDPVVVDFEPQDNFKVPNALKGGPIRGER